MKRIILFILLIPVSLASLKAQDTVVMDLKACIRYALGHSTRMKIREADNRDAQIDRRNAILAAFTPSISGSTYAYANFGRSIDPETNTYSTVTSFHNGYSISAGIMLFNGFQAVNNIKITRTAQQMGLTQTQQLEDQLCLATIEAYCNVLYYTELEEVLAEQVSTAEASLRLVEKQEQMGKKSHIDVVQLQADLSKCRYRLTNCHNSLNNALVTLKDVMFWPVDEPMKIDDSVPFLTGLSTPDSTTISVGLSHCGSRITPTEDVSMLVNHAKQWLPKVVLAKGAITNARIALKTARWQVAPSLSLSGGWSSSYFTYPGQQGYRPVPFPEQIRNNGGEYVQLSLSIPIYSHLAIFSNIEKRKNELKRASARYEQVVQEVEAEVQRAVADRDAAAEALQEAMLRASLQGESLELNRKRFEQGAISAVEYRTISDDYLTAVAEQLNARLQYFIKSYVVRYYAGERQLTVDN